MDMIATNAAAAAPMSAQPATMLVVDPKSRKLDIPVEAIEETRALTRSGIPSLCLLFLNGRCRQGRNCHQCHADPTVVDQLRQAALSMPTCCLHHGDVNARYIRPQWQSRRFLVNGVAVSVDRIAYTAGLKRYIEEAGSSSSNPIATPASSVCRLHVASRCRYSEDCKFLHVCRELIAEKLSEWVTPLYPEHEQERKKQQQQQQLMEQQSALRNLFGSPVAQQPQQQVVYLQTVTPDGQTVLVPAVQEAPAEQQQQWVATPAPDGSGYVLIPANQTVASPIAATSPVAAEAPTTFPATKTDAAPESTADAEAAKNHQLNAGAKPFVMPAIPSAVNSRQESPAPASELARPSSFRSPSDPATIVADAAIISRAESIMSDLQSPGPSKTSSGSDASSASSVVDEKEFNNLMQKTSSNGSKPGSANVSSDDDEDGETLNSTKDVVFSPTASNRMAPSFGSGSGMWTAAPTAQHPTNDLYDPTLLPKGLMGDLASF